jgi:hypothetical protein
MVTVDERAPDYWGRLARQMCLSLSKGLVLARDFNGLVRRGVIVQWTYMSFHA